MDTPVIMHVGSDVLLAGLAGDTAPRVEFEPLVDGRNPVAHGVVTNWSDWTALVQRGFSALGVPSQGASVLFTEPPLKPQAQPRDGGPDRL